MSMTPILGVSAYLRKAHPHRNYAYGAGMSEKPLKQVVAQNARAARKHNKQTQIDVKDAALLKGYAIDQTTVSRIEGGRLVPTLDVLEALAKGLGVNPWELLVPNFDAKNRPVLKEATEAERKLWEKIRESAKELGLTG